MPFLILGAGFTGERVARRLEAAGHAVLRTNSRNLPLPDVSLLETLPGSPFQPRHPHRGRRLGGYADAGGRPPW